MNYENIENKCVPKPCTDTTIVKSTTTHIHPKFLHTHTETHTRVICRHIRIPIHLKMCIMENIRDDGICPFPILKAIFNFRRSVRCRNKKKRHSCRKQRVVGVHFYFYLRSTERFWLLYWAYCSIYVVSIHKSWNTLTWSKIVKLHKYT